MGFADIAGSVQHAAFWTNSSSVPVDLGTLGGTASQADAINTAGQIVGYADTAGGARHAVVWAGGSSAPVDLNDLIPANSGWVLEEATAINDSGEIVGYGKNSGGNQDAFALGPPGPSLNISASGPGTVLVWWLPGSDSYTLQTNGDLVAGSWAGYGGTISSNGGTDSVAITPSTGNLFFRLQHP